MKVYKIFLFTTLLTLVVSCGAIQAPVYKGVQNVKISKVVNDSITVHADLNFNNPNRVSGKLFLHDLTAQVNEIDLGSLKGKEVEVPSKEDFNIPLDLKLSYGQIFDSKQGLLGTLLKSVLSNKIDVKLDGVATFKKFVITKNYPIHYSKSVKILK